VVEVNPDQFRVVTDSGVVLSGVFQVFAVILIMSSRSS
jgi:hypothetical protein